ncbi:MAG: hypothetical protein AB7J32_19965 [Pseudonocardia sp.]
MAKRRVPVEHRFLGLDRRTFPFAGAALAVWLLWAVIVPAIDDAVPWRDTVRPGDVLQLTDTVTMVPVPGWGLQTGLRTTDRTRSGTTFEDVVLTTDGISFRVTSGPGTGTPAELLRQSTRIVAAELGGGTLQPTGGTTTILTRQGDVGVLEDFATPVADGLIAALVYEPDGLQIIAAGAPPQLAAHAAEIDAMIASIRDDRGGT